MVHKIKIASKQTKHKRITTEKRKAQINDDEDDGKHNDTKIDK